MVSNGRTKLELGKNEIKMNKENIAIILCNSTKRERTTRPCGVEACNVSPSLLIMIIKNI